MIVVDRQGAKYSKLLNNLKKSFALLEEKGIQSKLIFYRMKQTNDSFNVTMLTAMSYISDASHNRWWLWLVLPTDLLLNDDEHTSILYACVSQV